MLSRMDRQTLIEDFNKARIAKVSESPANAHTLRTPHACNTKHEYVVK